MASSPLLSPADHAATSEESVKALTRELDEKRSALAVHLGKLHALEQQELAMRAAVNETMRKRAEMEQRMAQLEKAVEEQTQLVAEHKASATEMRATSEAEKRTSEERIRSITGEARAVMVQLTAQLTRTLENEARAKRAMEQRLAGLAQELEEQEEDFRAEERHLMQQLSGALATNAAHQEEMAKLQLCIEEKNVAVQKLERLLQEARLQEQALAAQMEGERLTWSAHMGAMEHTMEEQDAALQVLRSNVKQVVDEYAVVSRQLEDARQQNAQLSQQIDSVMKQMEKVRAEKQVRIEAVPAPTGRVALVFTDVEASTSQWEWDSEAMSEALRLHNELLRELLHAGGGYEVKTEGDSFICAFSELLPALRFCLEAQRRLLDLPWPVSLLDHPKSQQAVSRDGAMLFRGLRVRMGIHSGQPTCEADPVTGRMDYFGPVVNRAARIGNLGHGGQIVVSSDVCEQLPELLHDPQSLGVTLADMGTFSGLKGLSEQIHVYSVLPLALKDRTFDPTAREEKKNLEMELKSLKERNDDLMLRLASMDSDVIEGVELSKKVLNDILITWAGSQTAPPKQVLRMFESQLQELGRQQERAAMELKKTRRENSDLAKRAATAVEQQHIYMQMERAFRPSPLCCGRVSRPVALILWAFLGLCMARLLLGSFVQWCPPL